MIAKRQLMRRKTTVSQEMGETMRDTAQIPPPQQNALNQLFCHVTPTLRGKL